MAEYVKTTVQKNSLVILGGGLALAGAFCLRGTISDFQERRALTAKRLRRQQERKESFEKIAQNYPLTQEALAIVNLPFEELQQKLQSRELTAVKVLKAFVAKSIVVTKETNCITEFIPQMLYYAEELDKLPQPKGIFHGIPICIKDDHGVEGMDSTAGLSVNLEKPARESAVVVRILQDLGCVPYCKTNVPQTIFSSSSINPIYGATVNHLNKELSPGGSSSGTGCLVGAGGCHFGTGSDIGGSVRIPAHMSGVSTLRPTIGRISGRGITQCIQLPAGLLGVSGILTPRAKTLAIVFRAMTEEALQNQHDPLALPIPWNDSLYASKAPLRIGYFTSLPFFPTLGDTPRTVLQAKAALEKLGHTLVPFDLPDTWYITNVYATFAGADGGNQNYQKLKNDEVSQVAEKFTRGRGLLSSLLESLRTKLRGSNREFVGHPDRERSEVVWDYMVKRNQLQYEILDNMRNSNLDVLLSPAFPFPACRVEDTDNLLNAVIYTGTWNLVDFPAGIVPFGKESCTNIDSYDDQGDYYLKLAKKSIRSSKNMPIGVQIIGKPYKEEQVLRVLSELDEYKLKTGGQ